LNYKKFIENKEKNKKRKKDNKKFNKLLKDWIWRITFEK